MGAKKNNRKRAIILNHMFTGNYLEDNIGHEIVNLFSDDERKQYIYLCKDGLFNRNDIDVEYVVQVRRPDKTKGTLEIINIASKLSKCEPDDDPIYGKIPITEIFKHNVQQQEVCVTFKAKHISKPIGHVYIFEPNSDVCKDEDVYRIVLNSHKPSQQLREYILEEVDEEGNTKQDSDYYKLKSLIENSDYISKKVTLPKVNLSCDISASAAEIYGIQNLELPYSNAFRYFINKYPEMFLELCDCVEDEKVIKVYREWKNIDLIVECQKNLFVIENKIFSDLNGKDGDQLSVYHSRIEDVIKDNKSPFYGKNPIYILLKPDHNNLKMKVENDTTWKVVRYSKVYNFLKSHKSFKKDNELIDFARSLEPHAQVDYNFSVMQKRFVRAINKCKGTNITLNKIKNEII